jgi:hypothetical protein
MRCCETCSLRWASIHLAQGLLYQVQLAVTHQPLNGHDAPHLAIDGKE